MLEDTLTHPQSQYWWCSLQGNSDAESRSRASTGDCSVCTNIDIDLSNEVRVTRLLYGYEETTFSSENVLKKNNP